MPVDFFPVDGRIMNYSHRILNDKERGEDMRIVSALLLSGLLIAATGCVSKTRHQRDVSSLKNQVAQMDAALQAQQEKNRVLEAELASRAQRGGGVSATTYRTPSGFELPAADIQKALKG